jgi:hypothetical protein
MPKLLDGAAHWRKRAREARTRADGMVVPEMREAMLRMAADYERLARSAEERAADKE